MMNARTILAATTLAAALALTACGGAQPAAETKAPAATEAKTAPDANADAIKTGVAKMRQEMSGLKTAAEAGDAAQVQKYAESTDETWDTFEDSVKAKDKDLYAKIEEPLHAILAAAKVTPVDKKVVLDQLTQLDSLLGTLVK